VIGGLQLDGITPCHFQGYEFWNGTTYYRVLEDGSLFVMQGKKVLFEEKGNWEW
jgi:ribosomal protein L24E